jgi:hypothetical protein
LYVQLIFLFSFFPVPDDRIEVIPVAKAIKTTPEEASQKSVTGRLMANLVDFLAFLF